MEPMTPISDWHRPVIFDDSFVIDKASLTSRHKGHGNTFDCVLCGEQCKTLTSKSLYNNTSRVCQYCHHAELILVEHIVMAHKDGRSGKRSDGGMDIIPLLGPNADDVVMQHRTKEFSDAWNGVVSAEPEYQSEQSLLVFNKSRPRWDVWRKAVLYFSRINHVFAWITQASRWLGRMRMMREKFGDYTKSGSPRDYRDWDDYSQKSGSPWAGVKDYSKRYSDIQQNSVDK